MNVQVSCSNTQLCEVPVSRSQINSRRPGRQWRKTSHGERNKPGGVAESMEEEEQTWGVAESRSRARFTFYKGRERGMDGEVEGVEEEGGVHGIGNREALGNCADSGVRWPWECRPGWNGYRVRRKVQTWSWSRQPQNVLLGRGARRELRMARRE